MSGKEGIFKSSNDTKAQDMFYKTSLQNVATECQIRFTFSFPDAAPTFNMQEDHSMPDADFGEFSDGDMELFMTILVTMQEEMRDGGPSDRLLSALQHEEKRQHWAPRTSKDKHRRMFSEVIGKHFANDVTFRRYFRMRRDSFVKLCNTLCATVGSLEFKPEEDLRTRHYQGAVKVTGGAVCGEVRVAIFIRLLAGASYLDLMVIFDLTHESIFRSFPFSIHYFFTLQCSTNGTQVSCFSLCFVV